MKSVEEVDVASTYLEVESVKCECDITVTDYLLAGGINVAVFRREG